MDETIRNSAETINSADVIARIAALEGKSDTSAELAALRHLRDQYLAQGVEQAWELGATLLRESLLEGADRELLKGRYQSLQFDGVAYFFLSYEATGRKPDKTLSTLERVNKAVTALHAEGGATAVTRWKQERAQLVSNARYHLELAQLKLYAADEIEKAEELHLTTDVCAATATIIQRAKPEIRGPQK